MPSGKIVVIGNSCVDEYRYSSTDDVTWGNKIEATEEVKDGPFFGGAACNIVAALAALGCEGLYPLTAVGDDEDGKSILKYFEKKLGVSTEHIQVQKGGSSAFSIVIVHKETSLRNIVVLARAPLKPISEKALQGCGADGWVVLASLGGLAQKAFDCIAKENTNLLTILGQKEIEAINGGTLNLPATLRDRRHATLILNRQEFDSLSEKYETLSSAFIEIIVTDGPDDIMTNCDADGNRIEYSAQQETFHLDQWHRIPAAKTLGAGIKDTSGAGDLFCAGYLYARKLGLKRPEAIQFASVVSVYGISEFGAHNGVRKMTKVKSEKDALRYIQAQYPSMEEITGAATQDSTLSL